METITFMGNTVDWAIYQSKLSVMIGKQLRVKARGIAGSGFACPPLAGNFIYGLKPVELRRNIKGKQIVFKEQKNG